MDGQFDADILDMVQFYKLPSKILKFQMMLKKLGMLLQLKMNSVIKI